MKVKALKRTVELRIPRLKVQTLVQRDHTPRTRKKKATTTNKSVARGISFAQMDKLSSWVFSAEEAKRVETELRQRLLESTRLKAFQQCRKFALHLTSEGQKDNFGLFIVGFCRKFTTLSKECYSTNVLKERKAAFFVAWMKILSNFQPGKKSQEINLSLNSGEFAEDWKCGLINPILKKPGLALLCKNYRPVSNLQYVSKLTEKVVFNQVYDHMVSNAIFPALQSSYRQFHSTETALIKVMNDILLKMNSQHVTMLILLDLSAAFDTVDHRILLERLSVEVGIRGTALNWFRWYLSDRSQRVSVHGVLSRPFDLNCGVPQGSCLGPLLFIIYASKLFKSVEHYLPDAHCFADDTQLYLSFKPLGHTAQADAIQAMEKCSDAVRKWTIQDRLMINDDKTEFFVSRHTTTA